MSEVSNYTNEFERSFFFAWTIFELFLFHLRTMKLLVVQLHRCAHIKSCLILHYFVWKALHRTIEQQVRRWKIKLNDHCPFVQCWMTSKNHKHIHNLRIFFNRWENSFWLWLKLFFGIERWTYAEDINQLQFGHNFQFSHLTTLHLGRITFESYNIDFDFDVLIANADVYSTLYYYFYLCICHLTSHSSRILFSPFNEVRWSIDIWIFILGEIVSAEGFFFSLLFFVRL